MRNDISGGCIAHGLFSLGVISRIIGMELPGEGAVFLNENIDYRTPVYEGDQVTASVTVTDIVKERKILKLAVSCVNQRDQIILSGNVTVKMMAEQDRSLRLRRITEQDLFMIMNWRMSPEVTEYLYTDPQLTLEQQRKWYEENEGNDAIIYYSTLFVIQNRVVK